MLAHLSMLIAVFVLFSSARVTAQDHDVFRTIAQAYRAGDDDRCVRLTQYALYDKPDSSHIYYYINISSNYRIGNYDGCAAYASYIVPQDSFYLAARMIAHSINAREPGKVAPTLIDTIAHDLRFAVVRRDSVALMEALMMAHNHSTQNAGALPIALDVVERDVLSTPAWLYLVRKGVTGYDVELRDLLFGTVDTLQADPTDPGLRPVMMYCALISAMHLTTSSAPYATQQSSTSIAPNPRATSQSYSRPCPSSRAHSAAHLLRTPSLDHPASRVGYTLHPCPGRYGLGFSGRAYNSMTSMPGTILTRHT